MFAITERLLLRPGWTEDAAALARAAGDQTIVDNLAHAPWALAIGDHENPPGQPVDPMRPEFLICLRASNDVIGGIGLNGDPEAELAYWIARGYRNRGYATEAGRAVLALADSSLRLPRIQARRAIDDARSAHVLRKLGFRPTCPELRSSSLVRGAVQTHLYARERMERPHALAA